MHAYAVWVDVQLCVSLNILGSHILNLILTVILRYGFLVLLVKCNLFSTPQFLCSLEVFLFQF